MVRRPANPIKRESVGAILQRCAEVVAKNWLVRAKRSQELNHLHLKDMERTGHLSKLVEDLVFRMNQPIVDSPLVSDSARSDAPVLRGALRYAQGYTPAMLVHESRIFPVTLLETLKDNMNALDFSLLLTDVMTIADEVDAQLTQTVATFMKLMNPPKPVELVAV